MQVLRGQTPKLARLSCFMSISWRIIRPFSSGQPQSSLKYLRSYFIQKCKQAAATSEFVVGDISYIADVGGLLSLLPIFVYVCVTLLVGYPVGARACVCACVRLLYTCQRHFWQSLNLRLGVQRSPFLITGQRKPAVSLLFPRTVFAFQIIMITEGSVKTRWIQTNTKKTFRFRNSSRLACYIS
jgi:hypothetical protein